MSTYRVELKTLRILGWICFLIFGAFMALDFRSGGRWGLLLWAAFELLGIYLVLCGGTYDFDESGVTYTSRLGKWFIKWADVTGVEIGEADGSIILSGQNMRFSLLPVGWWHGTDRELAAKLLTRKLEEKGILPITTRTAAYKTMKNTRVK